MDLLSKILTPHILTLQITTVGLGPLQSLITKTPPCQFQVGVDFHQIKPIIVGAGVIYGR